MLYAFSLHEHYQRDGLTSISPRLDCTSNRQGYAAALRELIFCEAS